MSLAQVNVIKVFILLLRHRIIYLAMISVDEGDLLDSGRSPEFML